MLPSSNLHNRLASSSNSRSTLKVQRQSHNHCTTEIVEEPIDPNDIVDAPTTPQRGPEEEIADIFPGTRLITTTDD